MTSFFSLAILFAIICQMNGENIVIFHYLSSYSHRVPTWPLAEALSSRGHKVTYISPYYPKEPNPNISEIVPVELVKFIDKIHDEEQTIDLRIDNTLAGLLEGIFTMAYGACEALYTSQDFKDWLKENPKMDLFIIDNCMVECGVGLAEKMGAKYLIFSTLAPLPFEYDAFGYVPESSAVPEMETFAPMAPMGFLTRVSNSLLSLMFRAKHYLYSLKIDEYIKTSLEFPDMPYIGDLVSNVSLIFYTGDVFSDYPRALPPNFVNVAGTHCKKSAKELPEDITNFIMNGTSDGFVYLSLGSVVISSDLPEQIKQVFFETITSFPNLKFLWKWNGDFPKNIPENLYLGKWFPQVDILEHPKLRAFITQSGRPSALEAICNGVPMITFPVFGDQDYNANRLHETGAAIKLEIGTVTLKELKDAISKAVYDPRSKERMLKIQKLFHDKPMTPVETAVWWSEYVMRNDDVSHLRPAGHNQNWFVRRQIDVWAFISISIFVLTVSVLALVTKIVRQCFSQNIKMKQM